MHVGKNNPQNLYMLNGTRLPRTESEVDLGVSMNREWCWDDQINKAIGKANACFAWVTRSVVCRNPTVILNIYTSNIKMDLL